MKFTIITPSFRQLDWLELCVRSVADQLSSSAEVIAQTSDISLEHVVQDGGTPDFFERLETLQKHCDTVSERLDGRYKLRLYSEPDQGMYDAINKAYKKTDGDIFAWLNSDEQYLPTTIAKVHQYFSSERPADVLFGDVVLIDQGFEPVCYRRIVTPNRQHTRLCHLHTLSCATFFKRAVLDEPLFEKKYRYAGDAVLIDKLLAADRSFHAASEPLAVYAFTGENLSVEPSGELKLYWEETRSPARILEFPVKLIHWIRRFIAGGVKTFQVSEKINQFSDSENHRTTITGEVSGRWPREGG